MSDPKNVINAQEMFRPTHGAWHQETDDEMRLAFIVHVFGYNPKKETKIIDAINSLTSGNLNINLEQKGELLLLGCGSDNSESMDLWCWNRSLAPAIFAANESPCYVVSAAFNSSMAKCFTWFPSKSFVLTPEMKKELAILSKNSSVEKFLKKYHSPKGDPVLSERLFSCMKKQALSFSFEAPGVEEIVAGAKPYIRAEWFWINSDTEEAAPEQDTYSTLWSFKYLVHDDKTIEDVIETLKSTLLQFAAMKDSGKVKLQYDEGVQEGMIRLTTTDAATAKKFGFEKDEWDDEDP